MSDNTRVQLENLWEIGAYFLPSLANKYGDAAGKMHATRAVEKNLFETPGQPKGSISPIFYEFCELRDLLQTVARNTCINLRHSGAACVDAADAFSKADLSNAEQLDYENNKTEFGNTHKVTRPVYPPNINDPVK